MRVFIKLIASMRRSGAALVIAVLLTAASLAHAQSSTGHDSADLPSRVARLSWIAGGLGLLPAGATDWSDASINRPLTTGDKLSSGADARAELELGGATLRLAQHTDLGLLDLNQQMAQIELAQGTLNLSVRHVDDGQSYEIDTPTVALVVNQPGRFRVDIDGDATRVTAFAGNATVYGENNAQREVFAGRSYRFVDSSLAAVAISDIGARDSFDAWVDQRDQRYAQSQSNQYVPDDMVGAQDLDQYGEWQDNSDYGAIWYPSNVAVGWAPYRDGRWAYIAPWGWTWIDAMPWGYAPYHYGRWAHTYRGWGWIPGPRYARPIYAPALVAFVGGGGFSVGIGSAPVGWFPLGPGEIYNPWYHCDRDYYRRVNVANIRVTRNFTNVTIINNINNHYDHYRNHRSLRDERYVNRHAPGGFSAMRGRQFAAGERVQRNLVKADPRQLTSAPVMPHGLDVRPLLGSRDGRRSAHVRQLPVNGFRREVVARHAPPEAIERRISPTNNLAGPRPGAMPRPNVRVLSPRAGIPQVPRIQHADTIARPEADGNARSQRYPISPARADTGRRDNPQSRFQRPEPAARGHVRDHAQVQPVRREPPRQVTQRPVVQQQPRFQPPRYEAPRQEQPRLAQPQRTAPPPPRAEAPRAQRSEAPPARKSESRKPKDQQQR
ncbi:MAG: hypothetical protein EPN69_01020 [Rhodanobacter sp.]|nr:MAG: hypothetical protein EPN69_01020 [Rhodanobacter sp.]TAM41951.1 MAG: hypothetical protein EPN58_05125 [Rhodanobacter sp.]TAN29240.1 MAG: hypothetical protein EPN32_01260 [Rhodanobacter sp.]